MSNVDKVKKYEKDRVKPTGSEFYDISKWPELSYLQENYIKIKEEALTILDNLEYVKEMQHHLHSQIDNNGEIYDDRDLLNKWKFLQLYFDNNRLKNEQHSDKLDFTIKTLNNLFEKISDFAPTVGYSLLESGGRIEEHAHDADLSVMLPLICGHPTYLNVNGKKKYLEEGKFIIFNYGYKHSASNESKTDRLAVLLLIKNVDGVRWEKENV